MDLLPSAFQFRFAVPIPRIEPLPRKGAWPVGEAAAEVPIFADLDRPNEEIHLRLGWNGAGLGVGLVVGGKGKRPFARNEELRGDGLRLWIDTRGARGSHRAGRFCHEFFIAPHIGRGKAFRPKIGKRSIMMARDESPALAVDPPVHSEATPDGYRLEAWLPAEALNGFDPQQVPRIGLHAIVTDRELGERPLTIGTELASDRDPSLWTSCELVDETATVPRNGRSGGSRKKPPGKKKSAKKRAASAKKRSRKK